MARIGNFDIYEGVFYRAMDRSGNGWLNSSPSDEESVESIRRFIDRRNEWARYNGGEDAKEESFCIVRHAWSKTYRPDGTFWEEIEVKATVEIYPYDA